MDKIYIIRVNGQEIYLGDIRKEDAKKIKRSMETAGLYVDLIEFRKL